MPHYRNNGLAPDGTISAILALRLKQIAQDYPSFTGFVAASGLSRGTLYGLMGGQGNPTLQTLETLAACLNVPIWGLLGRSSEEARVRDDLMRNGLSYDEIMHSVEAARARAARTSLPAPDGKEDRASDRLTLTRTEPSARARPRMAKKR